MEDDIETWVNAIHLLNEQVAVLTPEQSTYMPQFVTLIIEKLTNECVAKLSGVHTIPRAYRLVHDSVVDGRPMPYVGEMLDPLVRFYDKYKEKIPVLIWQSWLLRILDPLITKYSKTIRSMMTSERHKDILLKRINRQPPSGPDTDKMMDQLRVDVGAIDHVLSTLYNVSLASINGTCHELLASFETAESFASQLAIKIV